MLLYPTIQELTRGECNRYELVVAVAKGARMVTDEYINYHQKVESLLNDGINTTSLKCYNNDEKAMTIAVNRIYKGEYKITSRFENEDKTINQEE